MKDYAKAIQGEIDLLVNDFGATDAALIARDVVPLVRLMVSQEIRLARDKGEGERRMEYGPTTYYGMTIAADIAQGDLA